MNIDDIQKICRSIPGVTESVKWEHDLVFSVGEKMFCVVGLDQSPTTASFKVTEDAFDELCQLPGFKPAPYLAKHKWVWVGNINQIKKQDWGKYLQQSYTLVSMKLSAKLRKELGIEL